MQKKYGGCEGVRKSRVRSEGLYLCVSVEGMREDKKRESLRINEEEVRGIETGLGDEKQNKMR